MSNNGMLEFLRLINVLGKVDGRKKLQKIVHILQSLGHPFPQHFGYLHYGPYSSELAAEINLLKDSDLLTERGGEAEFESYQYECGSRVASLLKQQKVESNPNWSAAAKQLNAEDSNFLEAVSTIMYLQRTHGIGSPIESKFRSLKPHLARYYGRAILFAKKLPRAN